MKHHKLSLLALGLGAFFYAHHVSAENPLITDQFTADPTARVFEGQIYVYPSHDIPPAAGGRGGRGGWFRMADYHVFSSENLMDWTDHGILLDQTNVPWGRGATFDMWAPDCVFKNGKYYFYYPFEGSIGVAIADKPYGPFKPEPKPIAGVRGIDPGLLVDKDGTTYLYSAQGGISVSKLKDNMVEIDGQPQRVTNLPTGGLVEGPFPFERNGIYYLTYPHAPAMPGGQQGHERLEYATSTNPMGPFTVKGVMMDENASGCWTEHHSVVQYKGQWYLFYHDQDLSPKFDKNRSIHADKLFFNDDGTIQKVIATLRGVGIADATRKLQIDRYSAVSKEGATNSFLDESNTFGGWKITLSQKDAWVQYDSVDFGKGGLKSVNVRSESSTGGPIEIRLDKADGPVLATVPIGKASDWSVVNAKLASAPSGIHDLIVSLPENGNVDLDWVSFQ